MKTIYTVTCVNLFLSVKPDSPLTLGSALPKFEYVESAPDSAASVAGFDSVEMQVREF